MNSCFQIDASDNAAVLLTDAQEGEVLTVLANSGVQNIRVNEAISYPHKVALVDIPQGAPVVKYGIPIGRATKDIKAGDWVHLHNLASGYDERSISLDLHSGLSTDMVYE